MVFSIPSHHTNIIYRNLYTNNNVPGLNKFEIVKNAYPVLHNFMCPVLRRHMIECSIIIILAPIVFFSISANTYIVSLVVSETVHNVYSAVDTITHTVRKGVSRLNTGFNTLRKWFKF